MAQEPHLLLVTTLGENNFGTIGPNGTEAENRDLSEYMAQEISRPEYRKPASNRWVCVDGRVTVAKMQEHSAETADPQTAGGLPITEISVEYMLNSSPEPISKLLASKTRETIANKQPAVIHGDTHAGKSGCGCNKAQRNILRNNAANIAIVTPIAWEFSKALGLDMHITIEEVTDMIIVGGQNAARDELWDATPEQKVEIVLENGGEYEELIAEHTEFITRTDISEYAFDEAAFIRDHTDENGTALRAFAASFGLLKKYYFAVADAQKTNLHEAALQTMAAVLHNLNTAKQLSNENMSAAIIG